jgi:hypothetical protein
MDFGTYDFHMRKPRIIGSNKTFKKIFDKTFCEISNIWGRVDR